MQTQAEQAQFVRHSISSVGFEERWAIVRFIEALQNQYTRPRARQLLLEAADKLGRTEE